MRECWYGLPEAASAADILCSLFVSFTQQWAMNLWPRILIYPMYHIAACLLAVCHWFLTLCDSTMPIQPVYLYLMFVCFSPCHMIVYTGVPLHYITALLVTVRVVHLQCMSVVITIHIFDFLFYCILGALIYIFFCLCISFYILKFTMF